MRDGACVWLDEGEAIYGGWKLPETAAEEGEGEEEGEGGEEEEEEEEEVAEVVQVVAVQAVQAVEAIPAAASPEPEPEPEPAPSPEPERSAKAQAATESLLAVPHSPPPKPLSRPSTHAAPQTPAEVGGWAGEMRPDPARGVLYDAWGTVYLAPPSAPRVPDPAASRSPPTAPSGAPKSPPVPPMPLASGGVRPPPMWLVNSDPAAPPRSALGLRLRKPHAPVAYVPATRGSPRARLGLLDTICQMPMSATHRRLGLPAARPPSRAAAPVADHRIAPPFSSPRPPSPPAGRPSHRPPRLPSPPASPRLPASPRGPHSPRPMPEIRNTLQPLAPQPLPQHGAPAAAPRTPRREKASSASVPPGQAASGLRERCSPDAAHETGGVRSPATRPHWGAGTEASGTSGGAPTHARAMRACATSRPMDASAAAAPAAIHEKALTPLSSTRFTLREPSWAAGPTVEDLPGFTLPLKYIRGW